MQKNLYIQPIIWNAWEKHRKSECETPPVNVFKKCKCVQCGFTKRSFEMIFDGDWYCHTCLKYLQECKKEDDMRSVIHTYYWDFEEKLKDLGELVKDESDAMMLESILNSIGNQDHLMFCLKNERIFKPGFF